MFLDVWNNNRHDFLYHTALGVWTFLIYRPNRDSSLSKMCSMNDYTGSDKCCHLILEHLPSPGWGPTVVSWRSGRDIEEDAPQEIWRVQRISPLCGNFAGCCPVRQPRKFASFAHEAINEDRNWEILNIKVFWKAIFFPFLENFRSILNSHSILFQVFSLRCPDFKF